MNALLQSFRYHKGELRAGSIRLNALAKKFGTPLYVYSADGCLEALHALDHGLRSLNHLICYAVKANSNTHLLKLLAKAGAGMDLVSGGELFRALNAKVSPHKIVFSGVGKTEEELVYALNSQIYSFHVESLAELELLNHVAKRLKVTAPVAFRYNPDVDAKTHPYISTGLKKNKFGLERAEVLKAVTRARYLKNVHVHGLSIHIGSQLLSLSPLKAAYSKLIEMAEGSEKILGHELEFLDLGGGVGIPYSEKTKSPSLVDYTATIAQYFGPRSPLKNRYRILLEPGRTIVGQNGVLLSSVLLTKPRRKKSFLILDASMTELMRPSLYGSRHEIIPVHQHLDRNQEGNREFDVVGPVCETSDSFGSYAFPRSIQSGDLVAILSSGAYGMSMATQYNSRPRPAEILVHGNKIQLIRRRENWNDLIAPELNTR